MDNKLSAYIGFARKSGRLAAGCCAARESAEKGKAKIILISSDVSAKSKKEMLFTAKKYNVKSAVLDDVSMEEMSDCIKLKCGVVSINDISLATAIYENLKDRNKEVML